MLHCACEYEISADQPRRGQDHRGACTNAPMAEVGPGHLAYALRESTCSRCRATSCRRALRCQASSCCAPEALEIAVQVGLASAPLVFSGTPDGATTQSMLHCTRRPQAACPRIGHNAHGPGADHSGSMSLVTAGLERGGGVPLSAAHNTEHQLDHGVVRRRRSQARA